MSTDEVRSHHREEAGAAELEGLWRAHWTIENRVHHVRDVTTQPHPAPQRVTLGDHNAADPRCDVGGDSTCCG